MAKNDSLLSKYKNIISTASQKREKTRFKIGPLSLNLVLDGPDGVEGGKLIEIIGHASTGKSTLALDTIATYQREHDKTVLYVDFERSFDADYALACGVDLDRLLIVRADTTEEGLNILEDAIRNHDIKLTVLDSIAMAQPSSELEKDFSDSPKMASNAGLLTRFSYRIIPILDNNDALCLLLNQWRSNFNSLSPVKDVPYGPKAIGYAASAIIALAKIKTEDDQQIVRATIQKNKLNSPQANTEFIITYGSGIDHAKDLLTLALNNGIITKAGSWYQYGESKVQGLDNAASTFPLDEIREKVLHEITK